MSRQGRYAVAGLVAGIGLLLLLFQAQFRQLEAWFSASALSLTGASRARSVGYSVIFPHHQQWIGFSIAASCTAALLIFPFFFLAAGLVGFGRIGPVGAAKALLGVTAIVWLANQLRLFVIGASMRLWGFNTGYARSHVLAGGLISTLGVGLGIAIFVALVLRPKPLETP